MAALLPWFSKAIARSLVVVACLLAGVAMRPALAVGAEPVDPDWPCIQPLVPELMAGQMWAGPAAESTAAAPADSPELAGLAYELASRSTPIEQAEQAIEAFAGKLGPEARSAQLTLLFHDVLELINQDRSRIISGIKTYTRKQRRLAERIAQEGRQIGDLQPGTVPDAETQDRLDARQWDLRVYQDRQHVLSQICEQPVLLDQRAFALARAMQAELKPN